MSKYIIKYENKEARDKVHKYLLKAKGKMQLLIGLYMKIVMKEEKNHFEFGFEPRAPMRAAMKMGGADVETQIEAVMMDGMFKLNDRFKKENINAHVSKMEK